VLVCHCKVVTDSQIRAAIEAGARDEFDVAAACGAATECGGCLPTVRTLLDCAGCPVAESTHRPAHRRAAERQRRAPAA
jgi:bacterioferritin-associated ferredoxin